MAKWSAWSYRPAFMAKWCGFAEAVKIWREGGGAGVVFGGVASGLRLRDFTASEGGAGGVLTGCFFAGFDLGEESIGEEKSPCSIAALAAVMRSL
ncbi:MAG: hypothetical protein IPF96_05835 [Rhodobacter sp.]|nr:hypothetical protein [Rhodobacter sp.]